MTLTVTALERRIVDLPGRDGRRYCVIGPDMCIDFHGCDNVAGLEMHYTTKPSYMSDRKPDFEQCWLHGKPCWCDGTSLYATDYLLPLFSPDNIDPFWEALEHEWHSRHEQYFND